VEIKPGSTNMRTRAGGKVDGVLTPGPHRDWRHWSGTGSRVTGHAGHGSAEWWVTGHN